MPGYQTKQELVAIAGAEPLTIRSLLDRNQFADPLGAAERLGISSASWPLFGLLWPSGHHLAARLARRPVKANERILEMGCGIALASLVAHRRGADITASDRHPLTDAFLLENLRLNGLAPMKYRHGDWDLSSPPRDAGSVAASAPVCGQYGLLVGSDLLYDRDASTALAGFIGRHARAQAEVWIVDPDRDNRAVFNRGMATLGFDRHEERLDCIASPGVLAYKGRLLLYRRGVPGETA
ncbi:MAG TPA: SAM-dependent methyltransferase [Ideonella sp.]|uniref:class I SAM-dependent methyltransferase n=1 Tax=Ideonella sp. TaxID=1929293 RepID=UPI002E368D7F|nr:SAM-dependent methyltransferase [Ideonella sp.]HEX5685427.1 SAM-dependent methyltransferase [Ideonella sp.]